MSALLHDQSKLGLAEKLFVPILKLHQNRLLCIDLPSKAFLGMDLLSVLPPSFIERLLEHRRREPLFGNFFQRWIRDILVHVEAG